MQTDNTLSNSVVLGIAVSAVLVGFFAGYLRGEAEAYNTIESALQDETTLISECDGSSCRLEFGSEYGRLDANKYGDPFILHCDKDYACLTSPMTDEIRRRDAELDALYDEL